MKKCLLNTIALFIIITTTWQNISESSGNTIASIDKPNIVLFVVDDMASIDVQYMPLLRQLSKAGVNFTRFVIPTPWCVPSRASILRGEYSNSTFQDINPGFDSFYLMGFEQETVGVWLQRAGYTTGLFGKYLNGYMKSKLVKKNYVPPGWDEWYGGPQPNGYQFTLNINGVLTEYKEPGPHINDELARLANSFIDRHYNSPMFLYIA